MLHPIASAIEQWHWGKHAEEIASAAEALRLVDPEHWLLRELAAKLLAVRAAERSSRPQAAPPLR